MNQIIYIADAAVIMLAMLSFVGLPERARAQRSFR